MNVIVAGIGGVGGYFGGLLAKYYNDAKDVEISFLARGEHLQKIRENGLKVIHGDNQFVARPKKISDFAKHLGLADLIIICTKSYDIEVLMKEIAPCIKETTILLPLLNGVDTTPKIQSFYPNNLVLQGCVYIVSRLKEAGIVENSGNIQSLYFGHDDFRNFELEKLELFLRAAKIEAKLSYDISSIIWEKYIFLSPTATATCYFNSCIGEILSNPQYLMFLKKLIQEIIALAKAMNKNTGANLLEKTLAKLSALPFETSSSMHADFIKLRNKTELKSLTTFVVEEGEKYGLSIPNYKLALAKLEKRKK